MDAKTRNLALLAVLSLFCAGEFDHPVLSSVFFVLGGVAAEKQNEKEIVGSLNVELVKRYAVYV